MYSCRPQSSGTLFPSISSPFRQGCSVVPVLCIHLALAGALRPPAETGSSRCADAEGYRPTLHCSSVCSPWLRHGVKDGLLFWPLSLHTPVRGPKEQHGHVLECWAGGELRCQAHLGEVCFKDVGRTCVLPGHAVVSMMLGLKASLSLTQPITTSSPHY